MFYIVQLFDSWINDTFLRPCTAPTETGVFSIFQAALAAAVPASYMKKWASLHASTAMAKLAVSSAPYVDCRGVMVHHHRLELSTAGPGS